MDVPASFSRPRRKTIAVLLDYMDFFGGGYATQIQNAFSAQASALDLNLLMVFGRGLEEPHRGCAAHNAIFEMVGPERVDGVIIVSSLLGGYSGLEGLLRLVRRFAQLPVCSIGAEIPDIPSLTVDDSVGMRAAVEHLVQEHHCRRVAFIEGTPGKAEAAIRLAAYREVLAQQRIAFDPALVLPGTFMPSDGFESVETLLNKGIEFDAIASANDFMAMGAVVALRKHGRNVPRDVRVTGFDDVPLSRMANPALTTVAQPFDAMAEKAIQIVLDELAGRPVARVTRLATEFVVRRSCGCRPRARRSIAPVSAVTSSSLLEYVKAHRTLLATSLAPILRCDGLDHERAADTLVAGLQEQISEQSPSFTDALERLLDQAGENYQRYRAIQGAVEWLRETFRDFDDLAMERLWADSFPRLRSEERSETTPNPTPMPVGRPTILLVDDSPILLRTGRRALQHLGYEIETLESGQVAYERFVQAAETGRSPFDLVILDMSLLERRDGLEILELIRQLFPKQRAILVSGHAPSDRVQAAMDRGLGWLQKPYSLEALATTVAEALAAGVQGDDPPFAR